MRLLLVLLAAVAMATTVRAEQPGAAEQDALSNGHPYVDVQADPDVEGGMIRAAVDIAAPPAVVFSVITDCDLAPQMVSSLKSCRIVERDPAGRWDVREQISKMGFLLPSIRNVYRSEYYPPGYIRFWRVGGDLRIYQGFWRIEPVADGSRVTYQSRVSTPFFVPLAFAKPSLRRQVSQALLALRRECLARVAH